ncbi:HBL048Wp [Eremothecium sinecaudum]|uniref:ATPase synthesis protein 25 n=1 Tax=Eremothecium sinecaudum TaxID=45286 RepID=A0A120K0Z5_9SACH|nr:HBL048Wp [Eremothecium sinecaudum]AMD18854.1 HBL048Wp [Eremothecium sinecaudum]
MLRPWNFKNVLRPACFLSSGTHFFKSIGRYYTTGNNNDGLDTSSSPSILPITKPWYLQDPAPTEQGNSLLKKDYIRFPEEPYPKVLDSITSVLQKKLGATNIICFNALKAHRPLNSTGYLVLATVQSKKHGSKSVVELMKYLKTEYGVYPTKEGGLTAQEMRKRTRRMQRSGKLVKSQSNYAGQSDWYLVDCKLKSKPDENVHVHLLTEERRKELNLEELFCTEKEYELYSVRQDAPPEPEDSSEPDNILAALKSLAMSKSRRYYSMQAHKTDNISLYNSLLIQDFQTARETDGSLEDVTNAMGELPADVMKDTQKWVDIFEHKWSLTKITDVEWALRWKFYEFLYASDLLAFQKAQQEHVANLQPYKDKLSVSLKKLFGYFTLKQSMGGILNREELSSFMNLLNKEIQTVEPEYEAVASNYNKMVVDVLSLYRQHDPEVMKDERIILRVLRTMVSSKMKMHALYQYVFYITESNMDTRSVILLCIELFCKNKDWHKLFPLYFNRWIPNHYEDELVWTTFFRHLLQEGDYAVWLSVLEEGLLLWLKRYNIDLNAHHELRDLVLELLKKVDPTSERYIELRSDLSLI